VAADPGSAQQLAPAPAAAAAKLSQPGCLAPQQQQQEYGEGHPCPGSSSSTRSWQGSADVAGPSLQSWSFSAQRLELAPEVEAVWWQCSELCETWTLAQLGSCEAYGGYCKMLLRLLDVGRCEGLRCWYEAQQYQTPVVIGAA
jgi:hypothetical protein